jgi:DNA repair protein RecO (recombination protein O)
MRSERWLWTKPSEKRNILVWIDSSKPRNRVTRKKSASESLPSDSLTTLRTEALVLRYVEFGESDLIIHLLVPEQGKLAVIAKGGRRSVKRFPGSLDLFNHVRIQVDRRRRGSLARLDSAKLIEPFTGLRDEASRFGLGCYLLELLDRLTPEDGIRAEMQQLFRFALGALHALKERQPDTRFRTLLQLRALDALGLRPEFSSCVRCAGALAASAIDFSVPEGGVVCEPCSSQVQGLVRVHRGTLLTLERGLDFDWAQLDRLAMDAVLLEEAHRLVGRLQRFHVGVELRSERFLDRVMRSRSSG